MRRYVLTLDERRPQTDFPKYIGGRRVWPALGDADSDLKDQQQRFKKDMIQAAAKVTATQLSISIVLMCIPVIGWILAAVNAIVSLIVGDIMKRKLKKAMDGIKQEVIDYQKAAQVRVHERETAIAEQLWPSAVDLANSGQPLDGLGDIWSKAKKTVSKAAKDTVHAVVKIHNAPVKLLGTGMIKLVRGAAQITGDSKMVKKLNNKEAAWNEEIDRSTKHSTAALTDARVAVEDAKHAVRIVTGEEQVRVAKEKGALLVAKAKAQIDGSTADVIAAMSTPQYQDQLVKNMAKAIRGDPSVQSDASYFQGNEKLFAAQNGVPTDAVVPTVNSGGGGLVAVAAAVGAFLMLRR